LGALVDQNLPAEDFFSALEDRFPNLATVLGDEVKKFKEGMEEMESEGE
jgi:hypothetical protein